MDNNIPIKGITHNTDNAAPSTWGVWLPASLAKINEGIKKLIFDKEHLVYAGNFLGKTKRIFIPSLNLLEKFASKKTNKVYLDKKAAWLFVCGRDIFKQSIQQVEGVFKENKHFLVMHEERCIGYAKVGKFRGDLILKNMFDIGDFLRRERKKEDKYDKVKSDRPRDKVKLDEHGYYPRDSYPDSRRYRD